MKISRAWLQRYFDAPLPPADELAHALTFHVFEIDGLEKHQDDDVLDVKVTPNRGHDCLSHIAIAEELSAILRIPLKESARRAPITSETLKTGADPRLTVTRQAETCSRFMAARMTGVTVRPSPEWLVRLLESIGQRSINCIVDATNYAMFSTGQPLHAFDARTLAKGDGYVVGPRMALAGEKLLALDGKSYDLSPERMVISGGEGDKVLGIAGVKGGKDSGVSDSTTEIIIEAATFDGVSVRKTAKALDLRTDASQRFEQGLSPTLAPLGLSACIELIREIAGGELIGSVDDYAGDSTPVTVALRTENANRVLGLDLSDEAVDDVLSRLRLPAEREGKSFIVTVPAERIDLRIEEDLIEEVGRIVGYDAVPSVELSPLGNEPAVNVSIATCEAVREELLSQGFTEVFTSVFSEKGDRAVLNKVGGERPFLRTSLVPGLTAAWKRNHEVREILGPQDVKIFEIGTVWKGKEEILVVGTATKSGVEEKPLSAYPERRMYPDAPLSETRKYEPFSRYPYIVRDIALWVPTGTDPAEILELIRTHAGDLLVRSYQFDSFQKGDRTSFAFRLVFQSFDRTLIDDDAHARMQSVVSAVTTRGFEVR